MDDTDAYLSSSDSSESYQVKYVPPLGHPVKAMLHNFSSTTESKSDNHVTT